MTSRRKNPNQTPAPARSNKPAVSKSGLPMAQIRRAPNPWAFLITGAILGAILGVVLGSRGTDGSYEASSAAGYFFILFGGLGALLGGLVFVLFDRRS